MTMKGYYQRQDKTTAAEWIDSSGKRFIRSGDFGRFDEDGFVPALPRSSIRKVLKCELREQFVRDGGVAH